MDWQDDVAPVLAGLDLLVIPSVQEGMPRILLEAFSAGVPVVATPPEAIEDEVTGFLVPESFPESFARRISDLMTGDPERLARVARNARDEWRRRYTVARYRDEIISLLQDLVSDRQAEAEIAIQRPRR
jgi:glycosyltransferase involved in cell wall biosynthesis